MLAPRRPNFPVQVLDRQRSSPANLRTSSRSNVEGRESLVAATQRRATWPRHSLKGLNSTANINDIGRPESSNPILAPPQASNASRTTYTVAIQPTSSASSKPEGGPKVDIESLPGQNQDKPALDDTRVDVPVLPGVNQDTSGMGEIPKPLLPADAPASPQTPGAAAITVTKPLPGQNQENPIMGEAAPPPVFPSSTIAFSLPLSTLSASASALASEATVISSSTPSLPPFLDAVSTAAISSDPVVVMSTSKAPPPSPYTPSSVTSFVTITRSEQGKVEASLSVAFPRTSSTFSTASIGFGTVTPDVATTQAVAAAQSASGLIAPTATTAVAISSPTISSNTQDGSILHPTARTLLILFVILGVLSILVAVVISMMIKSHRRRPQKSQQHLHSQLPYDTAGVNAGVTTHISAGPNNSPFLTASEKAIIDRAASPDGSSDMNSSTRFTDAISAFIMKSRSMAYKVSP